MPTLFNSQPNEETFRQLRSMGTINFTKINFTLLELFHLVGRVELQNDIVYIKLADKGVSFPRNKLNRALLNRNKLPSEQEISNITSKAKYEALKDASELGMRINANDIETCDILEKMHTPHHITYTADSDEDIADSQHCNQANVNTGAFVEIALEDGTKKSVRKSTYLWTLTDPAKHLSNDRLKRVQEASSHTNPKKVKRQLVFKKEVSPNQVEDVLTLFKNIEIQLGDWCVFKFEKGGTNIFVLGNIVAFKYIKGRTAKERQYSWEFASIEPEEHVKNPRGIEVLASWFEVGSNTTFTPVEEKHSFFIDINKYIITLNCLHLKLNPESGCLSFTDDKTVLNTFLEHLSRLTDFIS